MRITYYGQKVNTTPELRAYTEKRLDRIARHFDDSIRTRITFRQEGRDYVMEVTMPVNGYILRAEERTPDLFASVDGAVDRLARQVRKYKTRLNRYMRAQQTRPGAAPDDADEQAPIQRVKRFLLRPMDAQEAIMQMDLLGHDFFVFLDSARGEVHVVYRRRNGSYGLIQTVH